MTEHALHLVSLGVNVFAVFVAGAAWGSLRQRVANVERNTEQRASELKNDIDGLGGKHEQHMRDFHYARPIAVADDETTTLS